MLLSTDEDNVDVIESFWLYIFSVFPSFVYYLNVVAVKITGRKHSPRTH